MIYLTADTHFGHSNIIGYCNRPFKNVDEMDSVLIKNWNDTVTKDDTVFMLGDFAFARGYRERLNGEIIFIRGNHDSIKPKSCIESINIKYGGHTFHLVHNPAHAHPLMTTLCGHVHGMWKVLRTTGFPVINVGVDVWNYKPIGLDYISDTNNFVELGVR